MDSSSGKPRRPWWWLTRGQLTALFLVLTLIGGVAWWVLDRAYCAPGVRRLGPDRECIGVTDGSFVFTPDLDGVMEKIHEENRRVEQAGEPFVSIAYLVPLPVEADSTSVLRRHELQGAYLAQYRANRPSELGDLPLIRLLVANTGEGNNHWQPVVAQLLDRAGPDRLVAVAGLGQSLDTTRQAIAALTTAGMPVIGARLGGDELSAGPGFVRVAPSASDQVKAVVAHLRLDPRFGRALLIQDINPDDQLVKTLRDAFRSEFPDATHTLLEPAEQYDASLPGVATTFVQMLPSICRQQPDVVLFAGRGMDLAAFIAALLGRPCPDLRINVVTGGTGATTAIELAQQPLDGNEELRTGLEANATLTYASAAHPDAWEEAPGSFSSASIGYFQQCGNCFKGLFPEESLDDGAAIMGHDAVVTAVRAIRNAAGRERDFVDDPITPGEVIQQFNRLHDDSAVPGASGWISLDDRGNPVNKAIPILQLLPDGTVDFVQLSSPRPPPFIPPSDLRGSP